MVLFGLAIAPFRWAFRDASKTSSIHIIMTVLARQLDNPIPDPPRSLKQSPASLHVLAPFSSKGNLQLAGVSTPKWPKFTAELQAPGARMATASTVDSANRVVVIGGAPPRLGVHRS